MFRFQITTITGTVNGKGYKCVVTVKKPTVEENYNTLKDYINKYGYTFNGIKKIRWEDAYGDGCGEAVNLLTNSTFLYTSVNDGIGAGYDKGFNGRCNILVDISDFENVKVEFKDAKTKTIPRSNAIKIINISELTNTNNINFDVVDVNSELNKILDISLSRLNEFLIDTLELSLNDLGFHNYK